jgi:hypothetical protein
MKKSKHIQIPDFPEPTKIGFDVTDTWGRYIAVEEDLVAGQEIIIDHCIHAVVMPGKAFAGSGTLYYTLYYDASSPSRWMCRGLINPFLLSQRN